MNKNIRCRVSFFDNQSGFIAGFIIFYLAIFLIIFLAFLSSIIERNTDDKKHEVERIEIEGFVEQRAISFEEAYSNKVKASVKCVNGILNLTNKNNFSWKKVEFKINNRYYIKFLEVEPDKLYVIPLSDFAAENGIRFNHNDLKIQDFSITWSSGNEVLTYYGVAYYDLEE